MVTLSREAYAAALLAAWVIGIATLFLINLIRSQIAANRRFKQMMYEAEIESMREEIRAEVRSALGVDDEEPGQGTQQGG